MTNSEDKIKDKLVIELNKLSKEKRTQALKELLRLKGLENKKTWLKDIVTYVESEAKKLNITIPDNKKPLNDEGKDFPPRENGEEGEKKRPESLTKEELKQRLEKEINHLKSKLEKLEKSN